MSLKGCKNNSYQFHSEVPLKSNMDKTEMSRKNNTENENELKMSSSKRIGRMKGIRKQNKTIQKWENGKEIHFYLRKMRERNEFHN